MIFQNGLISLLFADTYTPTQLTVVLIGLTLVTAAVGYFLGSINFALVVSKALFHDDVRHHGSGNAGLTNMYRVYGKRGALLTLAGDVLKCVIAITIGGLLGGFGYFHGVSLGFNATGIGTYTAGFFAVIGHIFPIYYKFRGGKGVLCTAVLGLMLAPLPFAICFAVFVILVATTKYVSLGSVTAAALFPVAIYGYFTVTYGKGSTPALISLLTVLLACIIVYSHRANLRRISEHTESKFSFHKKGDTEGDEK